MGQGSALRQRRRARVRDALEAAAFGLFTTRGFEATTVAEIADAADMSPRNFFRYFSSKEDVVFDKAPIYLDNLRSYLRERAQDESDYRALRGSLIAFGGLLERDRVTALTAFRLMAISPTLRARRADEADKWCGALGEDLTARPGRPRAELLVRVTVSVTFATFLTAVDEWVRSEGQQPLDTLLGRSFYMLERELIA